jgi:transcriptional regulator with XRE-family HTH domain
MTLRLSELGTLVREKRGNMGVRAAAAEADVSSATFSRVENGQIPDLATFAKICRWLGSDPKQFLGLPEQNAEKPPTAFVHFKKDIAINQKTATSLAQLILTADKALKDRAALLE